MNGFLFGLEHEKWFEKDGARVLLKKPDSDYYTKHDEIVRKYPDPEERTEKEQEALVCALHALIASELVKDWQIFYQGKQLPFNKSNAKEAMKGERFASWLRTVVTNADTFFASDQKLKFDFEIKK